MTDRILGALGLCKKAGLLVIGFDPVAEAAGKGNLYLMLLARDLSPKSAKEARLIGEKNNIEVLDIPFEMDEIWNRIGKRAGILGVASEGLADKLKEELSRVNEED